MPNLLLKEVTLSTYGASKEGTCSAMGTWHQHVISLDPAWEAIRIELAFDSLNPLGNTYAGWFVDDVAVGPKGKVAGSTEGNGRKDHTNGNQMCSASASGESVNSGTLLLAGLSLLAALVLGRRGLAVR